MKLCWSWSCLWSPWSVNMHKRNVWIEILIGGFRGPRGPGPPLLGKKFGCLYRESLKRDWSGPPLRSVSGPPLMKISGSATDTRMYWIHKYGVGRGYVAADHEKRAYDDWKVEIITSVIDFSFNLSCMSISRKSSKHEEDLLLLLIALISSSVRYMRCKYSL